MPPYNESSMRTHLVMPPSSHAIDGAPWECVRSETPHHTQQSTGVPVAGDRADTIVVIPAAALSWHQVRLPPGLLAPNGQPRNPAKLRAVIEGLLEDQLLEEPAQLHFALQGRMRAGTPVWIAVCQRNWLKNVLQALSEAGHTVRRIVPEWAPVMEDEAPSAVWLTGDADAAQLVWTDPAGVHLRRLSAGRVNPNGTPEGWPKDRAVLAEPGCAALAETWLHREATVQHRAQRLQQCAGTDWNLAQAEFASRNAWIRRAADAASSLWRTPAWRPARWAFAVLCGIQVLGLNAQAWQARQAVAAQRSAIQGVLLSTFPNTPVVIDAPLQMQRAVDALGQASGQAQAQDLERMLELIGSLVQPGPLPQTVDFAAGELRLSPWTADATATQHLRDGFQARAYRSRVDGNTLVVSR
jgi:general secretion pathway protein L